SALRKDGTEFPIQLEIAAIPRESTTIFGAFIRDLSSQKEAEREIHALTVELEKRVEERTQQLLEANRELEGFTYSVSHDLRGPLRAIVATSKIVIEDFGNQLPSEVRTELDAQAAAAKKLAVLIDELLNYSRIGRRDTVVQDIDLTAMITRLGEHLRRTHLDREIQVEVEPGLRVLGDPQMIELALQNLLENSVKFTANKEQARIRIGRRTDHPETPFYVQDNGIGFDMQYVHKLFVPFERLHAESDYPGTGIGLANVSRVVQRHGGRVWAESEVGVGTTIFFTLPDSRE
ncbi:MAG TPA: ATP-binding protein, partial [Fimbriimonadaceae bacterium]|nr:ATP-binding protein [Fimbriimonadaceae bacterium]